jgi:endo-1,4-beta-xylanase
MNTHRMPARAAILITVLGLGCGSSKSPAGTSGVPQAGAAGQGGMPADSTGGTGGASLGLSQKYADYFPIGAAVNSGTYVTHAALLTQHFNSITTEDEMKFDALEPTEGAFHYNIADNIVDFATTNNMLVRGHTLVWHRQNPSWLFVDNGAEASRDVLLARMKNHISNVMGHFRGKVYAWDVVNEAIMETGQYRTGNEAKADQQSPWYKIIGESYVAEAFKSAREADPDAKLFYNDYYDHLAAKRQGIHDMLKGLLDSGVTVHGVGMQCHLNIEPSSDPTNQGYFQTVTEFEAAINLYASLGIEVQVTELDMSLYVPGVTYTSDQYYTLDTFTDAVASKQAERYREFFALYRKYENVITGVTFWGIADDKTWLSRLASGRQDFPLLFDTNHQPKKAYYAVADF